jgi:hypothetical protein
MQSTHNTQFSDRQMNTWLCKQLSQTTVFAKFKPEIELKKSSYKSHSVTTNTAPFLQYI